MFLKGRGDEHRAAIRAVLDAFGRDAENFVFLGGTALALYARPAGAPLRRTMDVDCISRVSPWSQQEYRLSELCSQLILAPVPEVQCRYRILASKIEVDIISPDGFNVGGANPWFKRAAERAKSYELGGGITVAAITPPYFLATKLVAFEDRGPDVQESKDAEDIVTLAIEVSDLVAQVAAEGIRIEIRDLWARVFAKYRFRPTDLPDFVDAHLHRNDAPSREPAIQALQALALAA
jgi:predicted nucleotidyltransferase